MRPAQKPYPAVGRKPANQPARPPAGRAIWRRLPRNPLVLLALGAGAALVLFVSLLLAIGFGLLLVSGTGRILPGVSVGDVHLGGMTQADAAARLATTWQSVTVRDGQRTWQVPASGLGLTLDAAATASAAASYGRGGGSILTGIFGQVQIPPALNIDPTRALEGMGALVPAVNVPAQNATIRVQNGGLIPVAAQPGRELDVNATLARLANAAVELADGALDLVMNQTYPSVTDAGPLMAQAQRLLSSPLNIAAFNPITNQTQNWSIPVETWSNWLTTENAAQGVRFSLQGMPVSDYLTGQDNALPSTEYIQIEESVRALQSAVEGGTPAATIRIYNRPTKYTVQPGETLGTIAWKTGIQMFLIAKANPGVNVDALSPGQVLNIPSKDDLLPMPLVHNKRIVVSITQQRMTVYENGAVKWDWPASTGIPDSPTQPGVYQVTSHDGTAYASVWNLYMPYFMSIYEAVPGFYNGIHGFPSRGGSQILWENALGRKVTYGCILLSTTNARALYEWAEEGVVVEIQP